MLLKIKKLFFFLFLIITVTAYSSQLTKTNNNYFLTGTYEYSGVQINYSAVVNITLSNTEKNNKKLSLNLNSFLIEEAKYKNKTYRNHDLFGTSFPIDTSVEIISKLQLLVDSKVIDKTVVLNSSKNTTIKLKQVVNDLNKLTLKISNTLEVKPIFKKEYFIKDIKKAIEEQNKNKSSEEKLSERNRLVQLGNNYFNENNYAQAILTYLKAKEFTNNTGSIDSKIRNATKHAKDNNIVVNTEHFKSTKPITKLDIVESEVEYDSIPNPISESSSDKNIEGYELIKTKKGYIKYRIDSKGNILIPYGKYEILRYKAGFAHIKIKDDVPIKNIVCTNKSDQFTWSARIYENPWLETVIDKEGNYIKEIEKKVEVYIVDNVTHRPNSELPLELIKSYEDPNPFKGTQQISAFNLWNREHSNDPNVLKKRNEIKSLKQVAKLKAYEGAENCRKQVSVDLNKVTNYYLTLGYDVITRD